MLRCGNEAVKGQSYPEELLVYPARLIALAWDELVLNYGDSPETARLPKYPNLSPCQSLFKATFGELAILFDKND